MERVQEAVASLGTILGVWAHPDDESYLSAAVMAAAVANGQRVTCITATLGEAGTDNPETWPPARLAPVRRAEVAAAMDALGVEDHRLLGYPDGGCAQVDEEEAIAAVVAVVEEVDPDTVLTFGPDGMTGHPDHVAAGRWAAAAVARAARPKTRLLLATKSADWCDRFAELHRRHQMFPDGLPPRSPEGDLALWLQPTGRLLEQKMAAMGAHASQVDPLIELFGVEVYRDWVGEEAFRMNGSA